MFIFVSFCSRKERREQKVWGGQLVLKFTSSMTSSSVITPTIEEEEQNKNKKQNKFVTKERAERDKRREKIVCLVLEIRTYRTNYRKKKSEGDAINE
jgi:hypothetical protein